MIRVLDWQILDEEMAIRVLIDAHDEEEVRNTPLKSHIVSTALAQLIEAVNVVGWDQSDDEIDVEQFLETLEESLDILRDELHVSRLRRQQQID